MCSFGGTGRLRLELLDYQAHPVRPATPEVLLAPAAPLVLGDPMDLLVPRSLLGKWKQNTKRKRTFHHAMVPSSSKSNSANGPSTRCDVLLAISGEELTLTGTGVANNGFEIIVAGSLAQHLSYPISVRHQAREIQCLPHGDPKAMCQSVQFTNGKPGCNDPVTIPA